ncbi:MAG: S26 family signal peptidase [Thermoplasmata archaeon]|nr:S26 family signal peptidase [Thermoplasmata archaeon]
MPRSAASDGESTLARWRRRRRSRRVEVFEQSMAPALQPGDRLLVDPWAYRERPPGRGDVVVLRDPESPTRFLVKRVGAVGGEIPPGGTLPLAPGELWLEGDWGTVSRDSRRFGAVPFAAVLGRAWWRYYPVDRRGPLDDAVP